MSKPKTLTLENFEFGGGRIEKSEWVSAEDYANMVDQRDAAMMCAESGNALVKQLKDQIAEAKAENERLRKAGDAMALAYCNLDVDGYEEESAEMLMQTLPTLKAWLAAKEGRDAK